MRIFSYDFKIIKEGEFTIVHSVTCSGFIFWTAGAHKLESVAYILLPNNSLEFPLTDMAFKLSLRTLLDNPGLFFRFLKQGYTWGIKVNFNTFLT